MAGGRVGGIAAGRCRARLDLRRSPCRRFWPSPSGARSRALSRDRQQNLSRAWTTPWTLARKSSAARRRTSLAGWRKWCASDGSHVVLVHRPHRGLHVGRASLADRLLDAVPGLEVHLVGEAGSGVALALAARPGSGRRRARGRWRAGRGRRWLRDLAAVERVMAHEAQQDRPPGHLPDVAVPALRLDPEIVRGPRGRGDPLDVVAGRRAPTARRPIADAQVVLQASPPMGRGKGGLPRARPGRRTAT